jgi:hypothetical protein
MSKRGKGSQVSGEGKVELKCFKVLEVFSKACPSRAPSISFYRSREGPRVHDKEREREKKEKKKKDKNQEEESPGATLPFSAGRSCRRQ